MPTCRSPGRSWRPRAAAFREGGHPRFRRARAARARPRRMSARIACRAVSARAPTSGLVRARRRCPPATLVSSLRTRLICDQLRIIEVTSLPATTVGHLSRHDAADGLPRRRPRGSGPSNADPAAADGESIEPRIPAVGAERISSPPVRSRRELTWWRNGSIPSQRGRTTCSRWFRRSQQFGEVVGGSAAARGRFPPRSKVG